MYVAYFEYSLFWRQWADVLSDEADKDSGYEDLSRYPNFIHIIKTLYMYPDFIHIIQTLSRYPDFIHIIQTLSRYPH